MIMKMFVQQSLMMMLFCLVTIANAEQANQSCEAKLQEMDGQTQQLRLNVEACLMTKKSELDSFKNKRQQYLRTVNWVEHFHDYFDDDELLQAIKERDILLMSKLQSYEACVGKLAALHLPKVSIQSSGHCQESLLASRKIFDKLTINQSACHKCSLATIGEGYEKSPIEILVEQNDDSRKLRDALYEIVSRKTSAVASLNSQQKWQFMRDVVISHAEDVADALKVSPNIVELLGWLGDSADLQENFGAATDAVMSAYASMLHLLTAKTLDAHQATVNLQKKLSETLAALSGYFADLVVARKYIEQDPEKMKQDFLRLNVEQRQALIRNIDAAVKQYGQWK